MSIGKYIVKQIENITSELIKTNFQIDYNWVSKKEGAVTKIIWSDCEDIAFFLKKMPYKEIYGICVKENAFNLMLIDGAIIQFMYVCSKNEIIKHRLAFFPSPYLESFQDNPENYEEVHFGNELFTETSDKRVVVSPVRFDYDKDEKKHKEYDHPYSHLTLGNYKNCRIPVSKPITPNKFIFFILRSFYFDKFKEHYTNKDFNCSERFDELLSVNEKKQIHISL